MAVGAALGPIRALPALAPLPSALQGHHRGWGRWDGGSPSAAAAEPNPHPVLRQQLLYGAAFSSALCAIRLVLSSRGAAEPCGGRGGGGGELRAALWGPGKGRGLSTHLSAQRHLLALPLPHRRLLSAAAAVAAP